MVADLTEQAVRMVQEAAAADQEALPPEAALANPVVFRREVHRAIVLEKELPQKVVQVAPQKAHVGVPLRKALNREATEAPLRRAAEEAMPQKVARSAAGKLYLSI